MPLCVNSLPQMKLPNFIKVVGEILAYSHSYVENRKTGKFMDCKLFSSVQEQQTSATLKLEIILYL